MVGADSLNACISVIILAGHETTANTLSWMLLELSRNLEIQTRLRQEIQAMGYTIRSRGDSEFKASDFDAMPYLSAVVKVIEPQDSVFSQ